jgi:adhesin HecA-like repeat protein
MINRPRTAFVSVAAVAVSMFVLGSDARAKSVPAASPKSFMSFLLRLPDARTGISLMQRLKTQERTSNILKHIPLPGPRQLQRIATLYNQEMSVFSNLRTNISALVADRGVLQQQYLALEAQKEALLSQGKISAAQRVGMKAGQVSNELNGLQGLILAEKGFGTPVR